MDSPKIVYKYYSNPAFCGQSEIQKRIDRRLSPLGANSPRKIYENNNNNRIVRTDISDNPLRMTLAARINDSPPELPPKPAKFRQNFQRQSSLMCKPTRSVVRCRTRSEDLEMAQYKQKQPTKYDRNAESDDGLEDSRLKHRYEVIRDSLDDIVDYSPTKKRIVEAKAEEIKEYNVDGPDDNEMKEIPTEIVKTVNGRTHKYAIVPSDDAPELPKRPNVSFTSPVMSKKNLIATQKLHELLSTPPRKLKSYASQPSVRITPNKDRNIDNNFPRVHGSISVQGTPSKSCANLSRSATSPTSPKAQKHLVYGYPEVQRTDVFVTSFRESLERSFEERDRRDFDRRQKKEKKTTAIISPRLASPPSDITDETYKSLWHVKAVNAATASLTVAAIMLALCGGLSSGLSLYIMYCMGRRYYLDFSVLAGFTCFLLGLLGFRTRRHQLLPNRNFISGYIVLSTFSLISGLGLLILLTTQPKPGTALNDILAGAVCAVSILCLALATLGVVASYCCARDPPDNRVGATTWY